jgi:hypothetical protein
MNSDWEPTVSQLPNGRWVYRLVHAVGDPAKWESDGHSYLTHDDADRSRVWLWQPSCSDEIASPDQLGTGRDQGFDTSVAAPNAKQGRAATVIERG